MNSTFVSFKTLTTLPSRPQCEAAKECLRTTLKVVEKLYLSSTTPVTAVCKIIRHRSCSTIQVRPTTRWRTLPGSTVRPLTATYSWFSTVAARTLTPPSSGLVEVFQSKRATQQPTATLSLSMAARRTKESTPSPLSPPSFSQRSSPAKTLTAQSSFLGSSASGSQETWAK